MSHSAVPHSISECAPFMEMNDGSCRAIHSLKPIANRELPLAFDRFYARIRKTPETLRFFAPEDRMARAKGAQTNHWENIANDDFNSDDAAKIQTIGTAMIRIADKHLDYRIDDDLPDADHAQRDDFNTAIGQLEAGGHARRQLHQVVIEKRHAAMAEQSTAATHALVGEPGRIAGMLAAFRIARAEASPQARRPNVLRRA